MDTCEVPLYGRIAAGRVALVDAADYALVMGHRWYVAEWTMPNGTPAGPYVAAKVRSPNGGMTTKYMHALITGNRRTDHRNGNGLDNRRRNLRPASGSQNLANRGSARGSTSRYKGVTFDRQTGKWKAQIMWQGRNLHLGRFTDEAAAAAAYDLVAAKLHCEYAHPNFL